MAGHREPISFGGCLHVSKEVLCSRSGRGRHPYPPSPGFGSLCRSLALPSLARAGAPRCGDQGVSVSACGSTRALGWGRGWGGAGDQGFRIPVRPGWGLLKAGLVVSTSCPGGLQRWSHSSVMKVGSPCWDGGQRPCLSEDLPPSEPVLPGRRRCCAWQQSLWL